MVNCALLWKGNKLNCSQSRGTMLIHYSNNHKKSLMTNKSNQMSQNTIWEKCLWAKLSHYHRLKLSEIWSIWSHFQVVLKTLWKFSSVQLLSHVRLFVTLWTAACQASLSITNYWSLPKLMSIELVMPSSHLIFLVIPFSSCPNPS